MNAELKSKIDAYLKSSRATVGKKIIEALRNDYIYLKGIYDKLFIDHSRLIKDNKVLEENYNKFLIEYLEFQKTYDAFKFQYNDNCEKLKETKEEVLKYQTEIIELKKDTEGNKNEIAILRNVANEFKEDNNSIERKLKFYKIGFYSSLAIIVILGLLLVA